jgi:DNA polymerase
VIFIDFETSSACDLPARGVYNYARDPSTQVLCLAWAIDDEDVQIWAPGQEFPKTVADAVLAGERIVAHNAAFERLIWSYVLGPDHGVPVPKLEQYYCTATQARANCAPGGLEDVGRFAGASMRKDHRGAQLVRRCCCPPFKHTPQDLADLFDYCAQDVRAMRAFSQAMRPLTDEELADYHVNERINDQGVLVDVPLAQAAQRYAAVELEEIQHRVVEVTGGAVTSVRSPRMREWVLARLGPEARKLAVVHKDGEAKDSIDKSVRANLLALAEENPDEVPPDVAEVIQAADDLWASSAAKFGRMAALADDEDHRVRGAFVFAGGSATGRASSYGLQAHNFPRVSAKDPQAVRDAMLGGHPVAPAFGRRVTDVLKAMLRPSLMARPGHSLVVADWSAIEGRVHPWLSNCPAGEAKLDVFRSKLDPYKVNAAATFGVQYEDVTEDQRQVGKVQELALGFLGGPGAFETFGRVYNVRLTDAEVAKAVSGWRKANPWAVAHGQALEGAYMRAMRNEGHEFSAGRVTYLFDGKHLWYALPSGRVLCYPFARLEEDGVSYAKASWKPAADAKEWPRGRLWRGLACENVTQATAADILRHALRRLGGYGVVLHVHDEIVVETPEPDRIQTLMTDVMTAAPDWAQGLPLAIKSEIMTRYAK